MRANPIIIDHLPAVHEADLLAALDHATCGARTPWCTRAIVIAGGAGAGRSTFLDQLVTVLTACGYLSLRAAPSAEEAFVAYSALQDLLAGLAPSVAACGDLASIRSGVLEVIELARTRQPVVIAIDEAANLDPYSSAIIAAALRHDGTHPLLLLAARHQWSPEVHDVHRLTSALSRHDAVRTVLLGPVDLSGTATLMEEVGLRLDLEETERVWTETGGHPLLINRLARELAARDNTRADSSTSAPRDLVLPSVAAENLLECLFERHEDLRAIAAALALLGSLAPHRIELLAAVIGRPAEQVASGLHALTRADLIRITHGRYTGRAPLLDHALLSTLTPATIWLWHMRAADWLYDQCRDNDDVADLAAHLLVVAQRDDQRAIVTLLDAADAACDTEPDRSAQWYEAAISLHPESQEQRGRAYSGLARASCLMGHTATAVEFGRRALGSLAPGHDRDRILRLVSEASVLGEANLNLLDLSRSPQTPQLLALSAHLLARSGQITEAAHAVCLVETGLAAEPPHAQLRCLTHVGHTYGLLGRSAEMLATIDRILACAPGSPRQRINLYVNCAYLLALHGSPRATTVIAQCRDLVAQSPCELGRTELAIAEVVDDHRAGRWNQLLAASNELKTKLARNDAHNGLAVVEALEADVLANRGSWTAAAKALTGHRCCVSSEALRVWATAGIELASGNPAVALTQIDEVLPRAQVPKFAQFLLVRRAEAQIVSGDTHAALHTARIVAPETIDETTTLAGIDASRLEGLIRRDIPRLRECLEHAERRQAILLTGRIRLNLAELGAEPEIHLRAAYEIFHNLGADPWRRRVSHQLHDRGFKVPRHRTPRPAGLTDAELQVARLVQQGRRNRDIAAALSMSIKTVESYLTRIYSKTDSSSRLELARVLDERD